jgi:hypothetical protein
MKTASEYFEEAAKLEAEARAIRDPIEQHRLLTKARYWRHLGEAVQSKEGTPGDRRPKPSGSN